MQHQNTVINTLHHLTASVKKSRAGWDEAKAEKAPFTSAYLMPNWYLSATGGNCGDKLQEIHAVEVWAA